MVSVGLRSPRMAGMKASRRKAVKAPWLIVEAVFQSLFDHNDPTDDELDEDGIR